MHPFIKSIKSTDHKTSRIRASVAHAVADHSADDPHNEDEYGDREPTDIHQDNWKPAI
jgi:hypothetical protein|tara:strand:+ start:160 stop:333 length:174 start_codon:yes stop_codon:yes gene_type:complete